ncbi:hypothetical protein [Butyrivibrio sp. INlla16]|uniref:hypothetical protein n=1 Tax=Butyrivibrio sp. INlla16 TaxID=1520807 RepID=UPI00088C8B75|nr:hypothetical protein [Butyrivibrio sp. INlla16]SDB50923.1 hypothetical protein SAMN02910263_02559 [Butyrivibrio sp. INlla16]
MKRIKTVGALLLVVTMLLNGGSLNALAYHSTVNRGRDLRGPLRDNIISGQVSETTKYSKWQTKGKVRNDKKNTGTVTFSWTETTTITNSCSASVGVEVLQATATAELGIAVSDSHAVSLSTTATLPGKTSAAGQLRFETTTHKIQHVVTRQRKTNGQWRNIDKPKKSYSTIVEKVPEIRIY